MAAPCPSHAEIVILAGGDPVAASWLPGVDAHAWVVAADSGLALMPQLGRPVDVVVGDLDSVDPELLAEARRTGSEVMRHPRDKDRTDLALALDLALARAPARVVVLGGHAGRLDHLLANALLLASPRYARLDLVAHVGPATVTVVRGSARLHRRAGQVASLLPVHGPARGVTTAGLRFPLTDADLHAGTSQGVSNELIDDTARVDVRDGVLLAVQPGGARLDADLLPTDHEEDRS